MQLYHSALVKIYSCLWLSFILWVYIFVWSKFRPTLYNGTLLPFRHKIFMKRLHLILSAAWLSLKNSPHTRPCFIWGLAFHELWGRQEGYIYSTSKLRDKVRRSAIQRGEIGSSFGRAQNGLWRAGERQTFCTASSERESEICLGGGAFARSLAGCWKAPWGSANAAGDRPGSNHGSF